MNNTENIEVEDLIEKIFGNYPKQEKTIQLSFETTNLKEVYENLIEIYVKGLKKLYGEGDKVFLDKMNVKDFDKMNKYMNSIGFNSHYKIFFNYEPDIIKYDKIIINTKTKLEDMKYYFKINNDYYLIYFSFMS